jgi:SpoVK/Ycf46/Vps4 family AAA+-type ATPase
MSEESPMAMFFETIEIAGPRNRTPKSESTEEEKAVTKPDYVAWVKVGERAFFPIGHEEKFDVIPEGVYEILYNNQRGYYLSRKEVNLDELFNLRDSQQEEVLKDIQKFWAQKEQFKKYGFIYKRGILLYGPPGSGKSSIINLIAEEVVTKLKGVVIYLNSSDDLVRFQAIMPILRQIEPDKQVLCVMEDLETFTAYKDLETQLLQTLSGANQMDNIVFLATTNYPEKLEERILNRPSRFDRRYEIGHPSTEVRREYFKRKLTPEDLATIDLERWVKETEELSLAHLGEIVKSVCALGNSFEETMELLEKMKKKISSHDFDNKKSEVGFKRSY